MIACPSCGRENPDDARYCSGCATDLVAPAPTREERKVVTVLFCDLVGSTARAEGADPEDVRALLSAYHERVRHELERFGGTVEKFIGDAVMALFGAPTAHEDDPERAVRAALAIREWAQEDGDVQIRIGVTTGEALVALGARTDAGEGMASGDVVNTAARLEAGAPPNGILVDDTTERATRSVIDYGEHEPVTAKGKAEPVDVWEAVAARSRLGVDVRQHAAAPLVGRERELELLIGTLERVRAERVPQLLTLVGAPGIGKSRLVFELMQHVEREPELVAWRQGRSLPYGEGVTFWALAEMVKAQACVLESDSPDSVAAKLDRTVRNLIADDKEAAWVVRHLRPLAGLAADGEVAADRHDEAFAAWRRFFEALAERRSLVLVFEDLQWADEGLLEFVDQLVDWTTGAPILILCTARPELLDRRPAWGGGKLNASTQAVSPLKDLDTIHLISEVLAQAVLPADTQTALLERAGGNPLYAEQFARLYVERGTADDMPLPESVQGIVGARLDALSPEEKDVLQEASVVGKVFWLGALTGERETLRRVLHALERKAFVRRERESSVEGEDEYAFAHVLIREVAYGQIPRAARADRHTSVAEWIESLGTAEHAELLAHHYSAALDLARVAGQPTEELTDRARLVLREAGDRASALSSHPSAARYYADALALWPRHDVERPRVLLRLGRALLRSEHAGEEALTEARDSLLAAKDREGAAEAEAALGELEWAREHQERALEHMRRAGELAADVPGSPAMAYVLAAISRVRAFAGAELEAIEIGREAFAVAEEFGLEELQAHALDNVGIARVLRDDLDGIQDIERSLEIGLRINSPEAARACWNLTAGLDKTGDLERVRELITQGLRLAERFGDRGLVRQFQRARSQQLFTSGNWDGALEIDKELEEADPGEGAWWTSVTIQLARDDASSALRRASHHVDDIRASRPKDRDSTCAALASYAWVLSEAGRRDEAESAVDDCLALALGEGQPYALTQTDAVLALTALGRQKELLATLEGAWPTPWVEAARMCALGDFEGAADLYAGQGDRASEAFARLRAGSDEQIRRALAFFESVGAIHYVQEAEALLAKSA